MHFLRDDIGGILITGEDGSILYEDERTAFVSKERTNWKAACPAPARGQKAEVWDLLCASSGKTCMVLTSTFFDGGMKQIHFLLDNSLYMGMFRDMSGYSKMLRSEKERDSMTGLYNKGKLMELKQTLFRKQNAIAVYNMDVNDLKQMNDIHGHEAGDRLIRKAAESLKRIEARNVMPFRVGGDEFIVVALHVDREGAEQLRKKWESILEELNRPEDGVHCVMACGLAFGEQGYDLEEVFSLADQRMYEDKKAKKRSARPPETEET